MHSRTTRSGSYLHAAATLVAAALAAATTAACSGGNPRVELSNARSNTSPVVTVTQTMTVTTTVATPVPSGPTVTVTVTPTSVPPPPFDPVRLTAGYSTISSDIAALDRLAAAGSLKGSEAALQLDVLAKHYAALAADAAPPAMDRPSYLSRVRSLQIFAEAASQEAFASSTQAAARYSVIRSETGTLFSMVNAAAQTTFVLPPQPTPAPSSSRS